MFILAVAGLSKIRRFNSPIVLSVTFRALWPIVKKRSAFGRMYDPPGRRSAAAAPASDYASATSHPKAVKLAFIPACSRGFAMRPTRLQSRQLGSSPLSTYAAQGTSAIIATHRRDCGRRSRPQTRTSHAPTARPRRPSVPDRRPANALKGKSGRGRQPPNPPLQSLAVLSFLVSRLSTALVHPLPASLGRCNERPGCVCASNHRWCRYPHHNITHHCITPRNNGIAPKGPRQVGKGNSRSSVLPAAGYTTRRYVKLLRQSFVAPFPVCPARS